MAASVDAADPETQYLGPPTDVAGLALAGQAGQPTLVWFHADWCHVCQQIKPEVVTLSQEYAGKVRFVRLNVDDVESRAALQFLEVYNELSAKSRYICWTSLTTTPL